MVDVRFPNESHDYRVARDELLTAEVRLRGQVEAVAAQRRALPPGGAVTNDFIFEEWVNGQGRNIAFSDLLPTNKDTLLVYSFMYGPEMDAACPMCTSLLDGLDGQIVHLEQRIGVVMVAKNPIEKIAAHARSRDWKNLRMLSSAGNDYNVEYYGEVEGHQQTMVNVFTRDQSSRTGFRHSWGSEMAFAPAEPGQNMRHTDMLWPLWNVLDMTPEGRGDWYPELAYGESIELNLG